MASDRRKSLNRLSTLFDFRTKVRHPSNPELSDSPSRKRVRKFSAPLLSRMSTSNWPLPENSFVEPHQPYVQPAPDFRDFSLGDPAPISTPAANAIVPNLTLTQDNGHAPHQFPAIPDAPNAPFQQRARSASSGGFIPGQRSFYSSQANPSALDLDQHAGASQPTAELLLPQPNRQLRHQHSENALRSNTMPVTSSAGNRSVSANNSFLPSRAAPNPPPMPPPSSLMSPAENTSTRAHTVPVPQKKKKGFFGGRSGAKTKNKESTPSAWIVGHEETKPYDTTDLANGNLVHELNDKQYGNLYIYLFPQSMNPQPSFKLNIEHIASSRYLTSLAHGKDYQLGSSPGLQSGGAYYDPRTRNIQAHVPGNASLGNSPHGSHTDGSDESHRGGADPDGQQIVHLYLPVNLKNPHARPLSEDDIQTLLSVRNLFAFLIGNSLIATARCSSTFSVFSEIADLLAQYGFSNMDSSTFGEVANQSFNSYVEELGLLDMRQSADKTLQCLILGEKMRSALLWNEAFVHAAGRYRDIQALNSPLMKQLSSVAIQRVERANMDLEKRMMRINNQITSFDFPSVFSGLTNSRTAKEREIARFEQWKTAFTKTKSFMLTYLKDKHKSWPPRRPKGAGASIPALNRLALKSLYDDLAVLYDLIVDRRNTSSRIQIMGKNLPPALDRRIEALRKILTEYDQSGSPVYPVMPFDAPRLPRLSPGDEDATDDPKKVGKNELAQLLKSSYNKDTHDSKHPFSQLWQSFEFRTTNGMTIDKVANFRLGAFLFVYCVLQALPMVTVDAPGVRFSHDVAYFLCQPPRGRLHWSKEDQQLEWYRDPITGAVTQLAKESIALSVEAMYNLSHCWVRGRTWEKDLTVMPFRARQKSEAWNKTPPVSAGRDNAQWPSQPSSEISSEPRYSATSSQGHSQVHLAYGSHQGGMQSQAQDEYFQQPQSGSPHQQPYASSPTGNHGYEHFTQSPTSYAYSTNRAPSNASSPDLMSLEAPPAMPGAYDMQATPRARNPSPYALGRHDNRESILMMGLERLPVPAAQSPMPREQRNTRTVSVNFDDFLPAPPGIQDQRGRKSNSGSRTASRSGVRI